MSSGELVGIHPNELSFAFELKKQISCGIQLTNETDHYVAFKVRTTNAKKYCVRPNRGIVLPRATCDVVVTMQAQLEAPPDMQCKDRFLILSVVAAEGTTPKDVTAEMFNKETGNQIEECKLRVLYVAPPRPPLPVAEGSEEGSSPRASLSDLSNGIGLDSARAAVARLTQEKNSVIQLNNKLQQELTFKKNAINKLVERLNSDTVELRKSRESEMDSLFNVQTVLRGREEEINKGLSELRDKKEGLEQLLQIVLMNSDVVEEWIKQNGDKKKRAEIDVDNLFQPADALSRQMLECTAADLSIEDTIYSLDKAIQEGLIPFDAYMRNVRALSREQFFRQATAAKVRSVQLQAHVANIASRASYGGV